MKMRSTAARHRQVAQRSTEPLCSPGYSAFLKSLSAEFERRVECDNRRVGR